MRYSVALLLLLCAPAVHGEDWLTLGGVSYHLARHNKPSNGTEQENGYDQNEVNPEIGWERRFSDYHSIGFGGYRNSENHNSLYASYGYRPIRLNQSVSAGFVAGLVTGYERYRRYGVMPVVAPVMSFEYRKNRLGMDIILIPKPPINEEAVVIFRLKYLY